MAKMYDTGSKVLVNWSQFESIMWSYLDGKSTPAEVLSFGQQYASYIFSIKHVPGLRKVVRGEIQKTGIGFYMSSLSQEEEYLGETVGQFSGNPKPVSGRGKVDANNYASFKAITKALEYPNAQLGELANYKVTWRLAVAVRTGFITRSQATKDFSAPVDLLNLALERFHILSPYGLRKEWIAKVESAQKPAQEAEKPAQKPAEKPKAKANAKKAKDAVTAMSTALSKAGVIVNGK